MYSALMFATVINLHCVAITYASATTNRTIQIQEAIPTTITHMPSNHRKESSPMHQLEDSEMLQALQQYQHQQQQQYQQKEEQQRSPHNKSIEDEFRSHEDRADQYSINPNQQDITLGDLHSFRLEYNKFRILSRVGIETDPGRIRPTIEENFREKLITTTALADQNNPASMRHKRSLTCDQVKSNKDACCLENFYVNFTAIGWDKWILYPAGYHANYCRGQCDLSHARYYHSTLLSKYSNIISLCCSPKQMAPLRLLYIDEENKVHQKSIPDMIVESCDCA